LRGLRGRGLHLPALRDIRSALRRPLGPRRRQRLILLLHRQLRALLLIARLQRGLMLLLLLVRLGRRRLWLLSLPIFRSWLRVSWLRGLLHLRMRLRLEAAVVARRGFPFASRGPRSRAMGTDHIGCIEDGSPRRRCDFAGRP